jgi:hypothetical protein
MNPDRSDEGSTPQTGLRKAWIQPAFNQLRAGSAEAIPGSVISDATLETIGS